MADSRDIARQDLNYTAHCNLRADWTESDLRGFGLDAPGKKAGGRPRGSKATRQAKTTDESTNNPMAGATTTDGQ